MVRALDAAVDDGFGGEVGGALADGGTLGGCHG